METKKSKVKNVYSEKTKDGGVDPNTGVPLTLPAFAFGSMYCWMYEFENGDKGKNFSPKDKPLWRYQEEAEYVIEEKEDKKGNKWFKISPKDDTGARGAQGASKYQPKKKIAYKADMVSFGFSYAKDLMVAEKLPRDTKLGEMAGLLVKAMWKLLDEIEGLE